MRNLNCIFNNLHTFSISCESQVSWHHINVEKVQNMYILWFWHQTYFSYTHLGVEKDATIRHIAHLVGAGAPGVVGKSGLVGFEPGGDGRKVFFIQNCELEGLTKYFSEWYKSLKSSNKT